MKYVMSDIHGRLDKYNGMLQAIDFSDEDELYVIGDVIDRGMHGIEILKDIMKRTNVHMIMGNHELMAIDTICSKGIISRWANLNLWWQNGGQVTYSKYLSLNDKERNEISLFLTNLPSFIETEVNGQKFHMVHGFPADNMYSAVWTRPELNTPNPLVERTLIIGHTPVVYFHGGNDEEIERYIKELRRRKEHIKIEHADGFIAIDCGCCIDIPESRLGCLRLHDMEEFYV